MRLKGVCKFWQPEKGFGFITRGDGGGDLFVHITTLRESGLEKLDRDAKVTFEILEHPRGLRATAIEVD